MTRERFQMGPSLCPFALENTQNSVGFSLKVTFLETLINHDKSAHGKWKLNLSSNRIRFNFENWSTGTLILFSLKFFCRSYVRSYDRPTNLM